MTIAIGMICKSQERGPLVILASDSQTTGSGNWKSPDTQKISIVDFEDAQVLVAQAGMAELGDRAIQLMEQKAKGKLLDTEETAAKVAEDSLRELRHDLLKDYIVLEEGKQKFCFENEVVLLLGFFFKGKPCLYTVNMQWCIPVRIVKPYKAIGIGAEVAGFLLREYQEADPEFSNDVAIAASVVEKTIDSMECCGRPTWIGLMWPFSKTESPVIAQIREQAKAGGFPLPKIARFETRCGLMGRTDLDLLVQELKDSESKSSGDKKRWINGVLSRFGQRRIERARADAEEYEKKLKAYFTPGSSE